jgi:hypothetical protein
MRNDQVSVLSVIAHVPARAFKITSQWPSKPLLAGSNDLEMPGPAGARIRLDRPSLPLVLVFCALSKVRTGATDRISR